MNNYVEGLKRNGGLRDDDFVKTLVVKNPQGSTLKVHVQLDGIVSAPGVPEGMMEPEFRSVMAENGFEIVSEESDI